MKFGYARVSTIDQNLEIQINAIEEYGVDKIFSDKVTGKNMHRKEFMKLLDQLRVGDTFIVYSLSRLGRKTKDLIELIETLNNNSITLISLKENIDTNSPMGRAMIGMISIFSELERVREWVKNARARGRLGGRPRLNSDSVKEAITLYRTNQYSINEIIKKTGVLKTTLYRRLNEFEDENDY